jgi:hypothetical protein
MPNLASTTHSVRLTGVCKVDDVHRVQRLHIERSLQKAVAESTATQARRICTTAHPRIHATCHSRSGAGA